MRNAITITVDSGFWDMECRHQSMMATLLRYCDDRGQVYASLRTIAEQMRRPLSWVQRALAEMQSLEYFQRERGGWIVSWGARKFVRSCIYRLHPRFWTFKPAERSPTDRTRQEQTSALQSNTCPQPASPTSETPKKERKIMDLDSCRGNGLRRVAAPCDEATHKRRLKMSWLRSLAAFAGYRWSWNDPERLRAEEAISRALDPLLPEPFNFPPLDAIGKRELERVNRLYREARRRGDWRPGREIA